jgi:hypothetical protein
MDSNSTSGSRPASVAREDLILYAFVSMFILLLGGFFLYVTLQQQAALSNENIKFSELASSANTPDQYFLRIQAAVALRRFQYAAASTFSNAARANVAFLIGTIMALTGCLFVIRRVPDSAVNARLDSGETVRFRIAMSSPGLFLGTLGTAIIIVTILSHDSVKLREGGITFPGMIPSSTASAGSATDSTATLESVGKW